MDLFSLRNRKAIVTGGCAGLGWAIAEGLAEAGAEVVLMDISPDVGDAAERLHAQGAQAHAVHADLADRAQLAEGFAQALQQLGGRLDILVNNAGVLFRHKAEDFPIEDWDRVVNLNLSSVFLLSQSAARVMIPQGRGKIINVASMLSTFGGILVCAYAASKGGVALLTKALGNEWASKGINVNALAPGYMDTALNAALKLDSTRSEQILERIPAHRWGTPQDLKGAAIFLASDASDYLSGAMIPVDGGYLSR